MSRARAALGLALGGLALVVGARALLLRRAEAALGDLGFTWEAQEARLRGRTWEGATAPGVRVASLRLDLLPPRLHAEGVAVDLAALPERPWERAAGAGAGAPALPLPLAVSVADLDLSWAAHPLVEDLAGEVLPRLALQGPDATVERRDGRLSLDLARALDLGVARGPVALRVEEGEAGALELGLRSEALVLSHPLLASSPLPAATLRVEGSFLPAEGRLALRGDIGGLPFTAEGLAAPGPALDLRVAVPDAPLADLLALFGPHVPEARRAAVEGTVGLDLGLRGPPWAASLRPRAADIAAEGLLAELEGLRRGDLQWRARDAAGDPVLRSTAAHPFVRAQEAPRLAAAVVAAEDGSFLRHPGYDLGALQEALDQWSAAPPEARADALRGASTLSQQLAKNLFLDGERTLARKLRELLYAVALERGLGKAGVLDLYLNVVELGPGIYGMAEGAEHYFAKRPAALSWREAVFLAAILPAPRSLHAQAVRGREPRARIDRVLDRLVEARRLDPGEATRARGATLRFLLPAPVEAGGGPR